MQQTLFYIPHFLFEGWLLAIWLVVGAIALAISLRNHGFQKETLNTLGLVVAFALVIHFILPNVEAEIPDPSDPEGERTIKLGLAVRGYGLMFLLGAIAGVGIAWYRGLQMRLNGDRILELAFYMFIAGIFGARLFYVIQYRDEFREAGRWQWGEILDMTEGGLVVYGSVIGGLLAAFVYTRRHQLPMLATADVIAPGMVLGLALGRIGCLMNGCCYGGNCEWPVAVRFPAGSAPYMRQYEMGALFGVRWHADPSLEDRFTWMKVDEVKPESFAAEQGLAVGDRIALPAINSEYLRRAHTDERFDGETFIEVEGRETPIFFRLSELPMRSNPVHPTQIYSAVNAALMCLFLWTFYPFRRNDGEVIGAMLVLYSIARFALESVRVDEGAQFGTGLSISQLVSIAMLAIGLSIIIWARATNAGLALPITKQGSKAAV